MVDLNQQYRESKMFAGIYGEIRGNFEEFMGIPDAGRRILSLPPFRRKMPIEDKAIPANFEPRSALKVIESEAAKTRVVIYGEEHHLPETRSLY